MTIPTKSFINFLFSHLLVIVCHRLPRRHGREGVNQKMTREGGGVKISHFCGDVIFEWPLRKQLMMCFVTDEDRAAEGGYACHSTDIVVHKLPKILEVF